MKRMIWLTAIISLLYCNCATVYAQQSATTDSAQQQADAAPQAATDSAQTTTASRGAAGKDQGQAPASSSAIIQKTTDSSGSPAMLSGNNGRDRDGTNNVQRASMNMAGAPAGNIELSDNETVNADSEMEDRQAYTRDKRASAENQKGSGKASGKNPDQINEASRRENNDRSDQNLSAGNKKHDQRVESSGKKASDKKSNSRKKKKRK